MKFLVFIALAGTFLFSTPGIAQPKRSPSAIVSPFVYVGHGADAALRGAVVDGLESWVEGAEHFWLFSHAQAVDRITSVPGYEDAVALARLQTSVGIERFGELNFAEAHRTLRAAREQYIRIGQHFVAPAEVSEVLLYEALSFADGSPTERLDLMKQMILVDPQRRIEAGAFADEVVAFYQSAHVELARNIRDRGPTERTVREIAAVDAASAYVLIGSLLPAGPNRTEVVVWLYDVATDQVQTHATSVVTNPTDATIAEASSRLASQLLTCLVPPEAVSATPVEGSRGEGALAVQVSATYASFYKFPDVAEQPVEPIGNFGGAIGASLFLTREFALVAALQFMGSGSEYSALVRPGFRTMRSFVGAELGVGVGGFRFSLGTLVEGTVVSNITTCPGAGVEERTSCGGSQQLPSQFLLGVNARPRVSYRLIESLQLFFGGSGSFYILPLKEDALNFLTAAELGVQYRF